MKAAQACVDAVNNKIDSVTGQITKAQVGIKTAERSGDTPEAYLCIDLVGNYMLRLC